MKTKAVYQLNSAFEEVRGKRVPRMIAKVRMSLALEHELLDKGRDAALPSFVRAELLSADALDDFAWTLDGLQLVSRKAKTALRRCVGNDMRFVPVQFIKPPKGFPPYWLAHPQHVIDCYDRDRSEIRPSFSTHGFSFTRFRIDHSLVPPSVKLWRTKFRNDVFVTHSVCSDIASLSLVGCEFWKIR